MEIKKKKKVILLMIAICMVIIIGLAIYLNKQNRTELYKNSYENAAWGQQNYGYIIYSDGTIEEFDYFNTDRELKKDKISKEELKNLKELANLVEDKYEKSTSMGPMMDAGYHKDEIYSQRLNKWIVLSTSGDSFGSNSTEESKKILELIKSIKNKYLK